MVAKESFACQAKSSVQIRNFDTRFAPIDDHSILDIAHGNTTWQ